MRCSNEGEGGKKKKSNLLFYKRHDGCLRGKRRWKSICELCHRVTFRKYNNIQNLQARVAHANNGSDSALLFLD